jgi:branched-chain amino acid transport system permease protein
MESAVAAVFEILSFGAIIVLVVLGLGIIASMMGIFNFAHGEFVLLGAYTVYLFQTWGLPVSFGMVAAPIVVGAFGLVLERTIIRRFYAAPIVAMLGTYALGVIIRESVRGLIGGLYRAVPEPLIGSIDVAGVHLSRWRIAIIVITILVMIGSLGRVGGSRRRGFGCRARLDAHADRPARTAGSRVRAAGICSVRAALSA